MGTYATVQEIKDATANVPPIQRATDEQILQWAHEAYVNINTHCRMNFDFERQAMRSVQLGSYSDLYLPKVISGDVMMARVAPGQSPVLVDMDSHVEIVPGSHTFRYNGPLPSGMNPAVSTLYVTGDWGYASSRTALLVEFANALKTNFTSHIENTSAHSGEDTFNLVTEADATDLDSAIDLLNDLLVQLTNHFAYEAIHVILPAPVADTVTVATDEASAVVLATALRTIWNAHVISTVWHVTSDTANKVDIRVDTPVLPDEIKLAFTKIIARVAIRDNAEDIRYHNSGFTSESFSDGYSYSLSDQGLRHIIAPAEMALLSEHVNEGRVAY